MNELRDAIAKLDAFIAKWPKDYGERIGYKHMAEKVLQLAREATK